MPRFTAYSLPPPPSFFSPSVRSLFSATQGRGGDGFVFVFGLSFPASVVIRREFSPFVSAPFLFHRRRKIGPHFYSHLRSMVDISKFLFGFARSPFPRSLPASGTSRGVGGRFFFRGEGLNFRRLFAPWPRLISSDGVG